MGGEPRVSSDHLSYNVRFWQIETRGRATPSYRVRWVVAGHRHDESFVKLGLAESFRAQLMAAAGKGEGFDVETGLPQSLLRKRRDVPFLCHCQEFVAAVWKDAAAKSRVSILEALSVVVPVLTRDLAGPPDPEVLRHALRKGLNQNEHSRGPDEAERHALEWLERASLPVSALNDGAVVCDMLDVLAKCLDGSAAAPDYFARRRRVMHRVLAYAVRKKRLDKNPLSKGNLPEGWSPPGKPQEAVDPRSVGSPELVAEMLVAASYVGRRQGPRFVAFFGCMFYAMMRPAEVISLTEEGCVLPENGWGRLIFADSSPAAGKEFTDDGRVHEDRGLKGRDRGALARTRSARARRATRNVPIPPELVTLLREHISRFGTGPGGRLFRSEGGNPIQPSTYWRVWQQVRAMTLTPRQLATPLLRRPYDLRHSGITWRLNSRVPATEVAAWAGHSVEVLMRVSARCVAGLEEVWINLMETSLRPADGAPGQQAPEQVRGGGVNQLADLHEEKDGNQHREG
jgi:integrase